MWFKQMTFYPIALDKLPETEILADKLSSLPFVPVTGLDWFSEGFAPPHGFSPELVFVADGTWSLALKKSEKVLPAAVVRDILVERVAEIAENEARTLGKKEKQVLKENIIDELLPRAFTRNSHVQAVCDTRHGFLLVNQASASKAENLVAKLREALGGLDVRLPHTQQSPSSLMTDWLLRGECDGNFVLDDVCELKGSGETAPVVKISKQDLTADEVKQHIKTGKTVTQLGLVWREQIAFVLAENFTLKRIQYLDVLQEEAEQHGDDAASMAFASQILMSESVSQMLQELVAHLGGWQEK